MTRNALWDLIQRYMDDPGHRYRPTAADLARETGVSDQVISKWKKAATLPSVDQLTKFSRGTGIGYMELLAAALVGKGYLPDLTGLVLEIDGDDEVAADHLTEAGARAPSNWGGTRLIGRPSSERGLPVTDLPSRLRKQMGLDDTEESDRDDRPAASKVPAPSPAEQLGKADYDLAAHEETHTIEDEQHGE